MTESDVPSRDALFAPRYAQPDRDRGVAVRFDERLADPFSVPLPQLGGTVAELWPVWGEVTSEDGIHFVATGDLLLGWTSAEERGSLEGASEELYARVLAFVHARSHEYPYLLRFWNHVGSINEIQDGIERYQRFCVGRYDAMAAAGYSMGADLPAASAVGMRGRGVVTYFLAGRTPGTQVENPRQVAAYRYPRQYGPKSPSFSRATVWKHEGQSVLFVSGTASVVGHESVHIGDLAGQIEETLVNLEVVVSRAFEGGSLADFVSLKTYVRHPRDLAPIAARLDEALPQASKIYLESDICRAELLLEIEGVAVRR